MNRCPIHDVAMEVIFQVPFCQICEDQIRKARPMEEETKDTATMTEWDEWWP